MFISHGLLHGYGLLARLYPLILLTIDAVSMAGILLFITRYLNRFQIEVKHEFRK